MLRHFYLALLADLETRLGRTDRAVDAVSEALEESAASGERFYEPELLRMHAVLLPEDTRSSERDRELRRALDLANDQGATFLAERVAVLMAADAPSRGR